MPESNFRPVINKHDRKVLSGIAPVSFRQDNWDEPQPVIELSFHVSLHDPSAFHVVLGTAAHDIATLHGQEDSSEALMHKGHVLKLINKRLLQDGLDTIDTSIAAVALLTGSEVH